MSLDELSGQSGGVAGDTGAIGTQDMGTQDNAERPKDAAEFEVLANSTSVQRNSEQARADPQPRADPIPNEAQSVMALLTRIPEALGEFRVGMREGAREVNQKVDDINETARGTSADMIPVQKPYEMADSNAAKIGHTLAAVVTAPLSIAMSPVADAIREQAAALKEGDTKQEAQARADKTYIVQTAAVVSMALGPVAAAVTQGLADATQGTVNGTTQTPLEYAQRALTTAVMSYGLDKLGGFVMGKLAKNTDPSSPPPPPPRTPPTGLAPALVTAGDGVPNTSPTPTSFNFNVMHSQGVGDGAGNGARGAGSTGAAGAAKETISGADDAAKAAQPKGLFHQAKPVEGLPHLSEVKLSNGAHAVVNNDFLNGFLRETPTLLNDAKDLIRQVETKLDLTPIETRSGQKLSGKLLGEGLEGVAYYMQYEGREPIVIKIKGNSSRLVNDHTTKMLAMETIIAQDLNLSSTKPLTDLPMSIKASLRDANPSISPETQVPVKIELPKTYLAISRPEGSKLTTDITFSKYYEGEDIISVLDIQGGRSLVNPIQKYMVDSNLIGGYEIDYNGRNIWASVKNGEVKYAFFDPLAKFVPLQDVGNTLKQRNTWQDPQAWWLEAFGSNKK